MLFGFMTVDALAAFVPAASVVAATVSAVILLDCVMSFLGASANDASFNAWVTDVTSPTNRGRVESVLAMLPLLAMLIVFGGLDGLTKSGDWQLFFLVVGALMIVAGLVALVLIRDVPNEPVQRDSLWRSIVHGLRPDAIRANPSLYWTLAALAILGISTQVFLPYLIIYVQRYLQIDAYALVLAVVLTGAAVVSVLGGRIIDRVGKVTFMLPAVGIYLAGCCCMVFARGLVPVILGGPGHDVRLHADHGGDRRGHPRLLADRPGRHGAGTADDRHGPDPDGHRTVHRCGRHPRGRRVLRGTRPAQAGPDPGHLRRRRCRRPAHPHPDPGAAEKVATQP